MTAKLLASAVVTLATIGTAATGMTPAAMASTGQTGIQARPITRTPYPQSTGDDDDAMEVEYAGADENKSKEDNSDGYTDAYFGPGGTSAELNEKNENYVDAYLQSASDKLRTLYPNAPENEDVTTSEQEKSVGTSNSGPRNEYKFAPEESSGDAGKPTKDDTAKPREANRDKKLWERRLTENDW